MSDRPVFLYVASYDSLDDAMGDFEAVVEPPAAGLVGTFDAAVIEKDADGKVHVHKTELPTQHGAWTGIGVGALLGILFPPPLLATPRARGGISPPRHPPHQSSGRGHAPARQPGGIGRISGAGQ